MPGDSCTSPNYDSLYILWQNAEWLDLGARHGDSSHQRCVGEDWQVAAHDTALMRFYNEAKHELQRPLLGTAPATPAGCTVEALGSAACFKVFREANRAQAPEAAIESPAFNTFPHPIARPCCELVLLPAPVLA